MEACWKSEIGRLNYDNTTVPWRIPCNGKFVESAYIFYCQGRVSTMSSDYLDWRPGCRKRPQASHPNAGSPVASSIGDYGREHLTKTVAFTTRHRYCQIRSRCSKIVISPGQGQLLSWTLLLPAPTTPRRDPYYPRHRKKSDWRSTSPRSYNNFIGVTQYYLNGTSPQ